MSLLPILHLLTFLLLAPFLSLALTILYFYRRLVECLLKIQLKEKFVGLLDGTDCIWAVEEPSALSIINILVILEKDSKLSSISTIETFRNLVRDRLVSSSLGKLMYRRNKRYGYYFWEKDEDIDLEERVRWLEHERSTCDGACDNVYNESLKKVLRNVSNQPLPRNHSTSWEILVGKTCSRSSYHHLRRMGEGKVFVGDRGKNNRIRIPVLFRVHHSLGDGIALLRLLLEVIADKDVMHREPFLESEEFKLPKMKEDVEVVTVSQWNRAKMVLTEKEQDIMDNYKADVLAASMPFLYANLQETGRSILEYLSGKAKILEYLTLEAVMREIENIFWEAAKNFKDLMAEGVLEDLKDAISIMKTLATAPICLVQQAIRSMDKSALHGPRLSGEKMISYWLEDDFRNSNEQKLLEKIRYIKNITGAKFVDIVLAALSASLHKYFFKIGDEAPNTLTVVLPHTTRASDDPLILQNTFSVGLLPLCISKINGHIFENPNEDSKILDRLQDITNANGRLEASPDCTINLWVMKFLSACLPEILLRPILESHSTMAFSNLPGPQEVKILNHSLKNVAFWIPNRSSTGIGCSLLSYRGYLHLSLVADRVLINDEKLLTEILENTVCEIDCLYETLTSSCFARRLRADVTSPTE